MMDFWIDWSHMNYLSIFTYDINKMVKSLIKSHWNWTTEIHIHSYIHSFIFFSCRLSSVIVFIADSYLNFFLCSLGECWAAWCWFGLRDLAVLHRTCGQKHSYWFLQCCSMFPAVLSWEHRPSAPHFSPLWSSVDTDLWHDLSPLTQLLQEGKLLWYHWPDGVRYF